MIETIKLPKDPTALANIIDQHAEREEQNLNYRRTMWLLAYHYLQGARRFDVFDPSLGRLSPHFLDEDGRLEFQSQELIAAIDKVSSTIASLDLSPKVERKGHTLSAIKERSVAQILLDSTINNNQIEKVKTEFSYIFAALGSCGLAGHVSTHPTVGLVTDLEVVHPRELFPFPSVGEDYTKANGLMRQRVVPMSYLTDLYGPRIKKNLGKMEYYEAQIGEVYGVDDDDNFYNRDVNSGYSINTGKSTSGVDKEHHHLVKIRELWTFGAAETVTKYVIASGEYIIEDQDFEGLEVYCPIGFARFMENGTFHGMGMFDLLFGVSREMEKLIKNLFNNVHDADKYGVLVMPQGQVNERSLLRDVGKGLKVLPFEPDPVAEGFRPFNISPATMGQVPGQTAMFAKQLMDGLNPIRDLISEKGRIDSAAGLSALQEQASIAMNTPMRGVEKAFSQCYKSCLNGIVRQLTAMPMQIRVEKLTLDLAGVIIDPQKNLISFGGINPIPTLQDLKFTIRQRTPESQAAKKAELLQYLGSGLTDPMAFKIYAMEEGIDVAMYMDTEKNAYEQIIRNILLLFGDGSTPGQIIVTPQTSLPELQLRVLSSFMTSPVMGVADPEVQDVFKGYREFLMQSLGQVMPDAVPNPEDTLALQGGM